MNCKHCGAELEENVTVCPFCDKAVEEASVVEEVIPAEEAAPVEELIPEEAAPVEEVAPVEEAAPVKKPRKPMGKGPKIIIAISLALVLLLGIAAGALYAFGYSFDFDNWKNEIHVKTSYTAPDFLAKLSADTVVANLGGKELTNGMLQLYYGRQLWDLVEEYGDYLSYLGLDLTKPLGQQPFPYAEDMTWEQYLLTMAIDAWAQQQTLVNLAEEENFQYPQGLQTYLDGLKATLDAQAVQYGFKDGNELVQKEMGASTDLELYKHYSEIYNKGLEYYSKLYESMEPDATQVEKYFDEHAEELQEQYNVTKVEKPVIDVRHILLVPQVDTEESKAVCLKRAEELLQQWKDGEATEESFAKLASEHTEDSGSKNTGGLYEFVYQGDMTEAFDAWCFDASRKPGDTGIVETNYGYHIMYFVYGADEWYRAAYQSMCSAMCNEMIATASKRYDLQVFYPQIVLSQIDFE